MTQEELKALNAKLDRILEKQSATIETLQRMIDSLVKKQEPQEKAEVK